MKKLDTLNVILLKDPCNLIHKNSMSRVCKMTQIENEKNQIKKVCKNKNNKFY